MAAHCAWRRGTCAVSATAVASWGWRGAGAASSAATAWRRTARRWLSAVPAAAADTGLPHCPAFGMYPGDRKIPYVTSLDTHDPATQPVMPIYRVMDEDGTIRPGAEDPDVGQETCTRIYSCMMRLQTMDNIFYDAQRQGRISFYMTNWGEEGTHFGTAMAWKDDDEVFAQYREAGVLMWRGFTLQQFADQLFSNKDDLGKGRQMPVHYGSAALHFQTISSPLATQIPQATGAGYFAKREGKGRVVACYFGEGAASEGDFHAALNAASTLKTPVVFVCRNNGFAISTPVAEQYNGDGIAARGLSYGMHTIRVDGNDVWAVLSASRRARQIASGEDGTGATKPVLIEAMTYREGHHSTSDDSTRYRTPEEIKAWREVSNPVRRLRRYMERRGWWNAEKDEALAAAERQAVLQAMATAERKEKPEVKELFADVYGGAELPLHLQRQYDDLLAHAAKYPDHYTPGH